MRGWLDSSVRFLCASNGTTLQRRKHQLRSFLALQYHYLLKPTNVVTTELLGPDIDKKNNECNKMQEATKKLQIRERPRQWQGGMEPLGAISVVAQDRVLTAVEVQTQISSRGWHLTIKSIISSALGIVPAEVAVIQCPVILERSRHLDRFARFILILL